MSCLFFARFFQIVGKIAPLRMHGQVSFQMALQIRHVAFQLADNIILRGFLMLQLVEEGVNNWILSHLTIHANENLSTVTRLQSKTTLVFGN